MPELPEIQAIVTSGFAHLHHGRYFFLQVANRKLAQAWLRAILPHVATSARRPDGPKKRPDTIVQVCFSATGLAAMGLDPGNLKVQFPREFFIGMAGGERPNVLGDTGDSAPDKWQVGGAANWTDDDKPVSNLHLLLMLYTTSTAELDRVMHTHLADAAAAGLKELYRQDSRRDPEGREPFGYLDGISQPAILGVPAKVLPGQDVLQPGEFLLGYENGYEQQSPTPKVPAALDVNNVLPAGEQPDQKDFGRNGTFLIFRKLAQDVDLLNSFVSDLARKPDGTVDHARKDLIEAKFVGRWKSGAPLTLSPDQDDPALGKDSKRNNDFMFRPTDEQGDRCPVGAHIRRCNPRDALMANAKGEKSVTISNRHRIIRRGRPFLDEQEPLKKNQQGLLFICVNADIQRQFEFIQQTWINNEKFDGLYEDKDPLVGNVDSPPGSTGTHTIQGCPVRHRVKGIPRFVHVRGGGYFFMPSISALKFLSALV